MPHYRCVGDVPPKRHTRHTDGEGALLYEELVGEEGFSASSSLLYHRHVPAALVAVQEMPGGNADLGANEPLRPRHFRTVAIEGSSDVVTGRRLLLGNTEVRIHVVTARAPSPLFRDAVGDELVYVAKGAARLDTALGAIRVGGGDHVLVPKGVVHRWVPEGDEPLRCLVIESDGHLGPPSRYLSRTGQFLEHAPYCERDLRGPTAPLLESGEDVDVIVQHRGLDGRRAQTRCTYAHHPFDVVGWDGCNYPVALSVHDFEPITGRVHQPPPVHQVFEGPGFVVCNFVPRKVDYHPLAIPVPYYHSNVDSDEVLFYCEGNYEARRGSGVEQWSVTLHPAGHVHGPNPRAYEQSTGIERFDELAIMVDTFRPLGLGIDALACEDPSYAWSWAKAESSPR